MTALFQSMCNDFYTQWLIHMIVITFFQDKSYKLFDQGAKRNNLISLKLESP